MEENRKEGSVNELVNEIFTNDNLENFQLIFEQANDPKELFTLLLEIFRKGMKLLYSNDEGVVDLDTMSMEQFLFIKNKFEKLGFKIEFEKVECTVKQEIEGKVKDQNTIDYSQLGGGGVEQDEVGVEDPELYLSDGSDDSELPPIGEYISHDIEKIPVEEEDKLSDLFFTLKTDKYNYKLWFDFLF
jgi:hypothetical protein